MKPIYGHRGKFYFNSAYSSNYSLSKSQHTLEYIDKDVEVTHLATITSP